MRTQTDVIVTQYRAEFKAEPFARPRWEIVGGWQTRETLPRRRRWTVTRDVFLTHDLAHDEPARKRPNTGVGHIHASNLVDADAVVVFVPDTQASRYGVAVVIEEIAR